MITCMSLQAYHVSGFPWATSTSISGHTTGGCTYVPGWAKSYIISTKGSSQCCLTESGGLCSPQPLCFYPHELGVFISQVQKLESKEATSVPRDSLLGHSTAGHMAASHDCSQVGSQALESDHDSADPVASTFQSCTICLIPSFQKTCLCSLVCLRSRM